VFVEVKARKSARFGSGIEAVTPHKLARLQRVASYFLQTHPNLPQSGRIDIVSVTNREPEKPAIEHIENVF
jgi:putative endonuclease